VRRFVLPVVALAALMAALAVAVATAGTYTGSITNSDPSHTNFENFASGGPSVCGPTPAAPGTITDSSSYHYDTISQVNSSGTAQCATITVSEVTGAGSLGVAAYAYIGSFDPSNVSTNYAGGYNSQIPVGGTGSFGVTVLAGQTLVVEIEEYVAGTGAGYMVEISGLDAPTPTPTPTPNPTPEPTTTPTPDPTPEPTLGTQVSSTTAVVNQTSITDTATLSGPNGTVTGSVAFFVCGPTGGATPCVAGGASVGSTTLNSEQATSDPFTPTAAGTYCFRAEYTPDSGAPYSSSASSVTTNECFTAVVATATPTPTSTPTPPTLTPTPTPTPTPSIGALPSGYWKNHLANSKTGPFSDSTCNSLPKGTSCSTSGPWAKQYLPKLLGNYSVDTITKAADIFKAANCSAQKDQDAIACLTGELLTTKLNLANGSLACPSILQAVADSDAFLKGQTVNGVPGINYVGPSGKYTLTTAQRNLVISLKNKLNAYDNNVNCP